MYKKVDRDVSSDCIRDEKYCYNLVAWVTTVVHGCGMTESLWLVNLVCSRNTVQYDHG